MALMRVADHDSFACAARKLSNFMTLLALPYGRKALARYGIDATGERVDRLHRVGNT